MDLVHPAVQAYAEELSTPLDSLSREVLDYTLKNHPESQMISGAFQGRFLAMISSLIHPRRILEIGTFTGFSALMLAAGLSENGILHTIELREEDADRAQSYFDRSPYRDQILLHRGNALNIIPKLEETWDLVFIDADKPAYIDYFNLVFPRLRKNGYIFADNIFFHGEVLQSPLKGKNAKAMRAFNDFIRQRDDIEKIALTIRDGLYLLRKI